MKELQNILKVWEQIEATSTLSALATVVEVHGSAYRRPGARMLLSQDGQSVGSISGGCLDGDIWLRARQVMESGQPVLATYDTTDPDDIIWGSGLGCRGIVRVLIEPIAFNLSLRTFLSDALSSSSCNVVATVYNTEGAIELKIKSRLMLGGDGSITSDIKNSRLVNQIQSDAREVLSCRRSANKIYQLQDGKAEVFIEFIAPPQPLIIFGAGPDVIPLVQLANALGWEVTVVNTRPSTPLPYHFDEASEIITIEVESVTSHLSLNARAVVVVMTHNFLHDWELLKFLLPSPVQYIGLLGPRVRTDELLRVLPKQSRTMGMTPTSEQLTRLFAPVGLDIGAETPEEIALSIISEIKAHLSSRTGSFLRERKKRIHVDDTVNEREGANEK